MNSAAVNVPLKVSLAGHGNPAGPVLAYLPGLHGDNTLAGSFRARLGADIRLVEVIYPATVAWTLADYAAAVWHALRACTDQPLWLLAESFGSQIAWAMLRQSADAGTTPPVRGLILAGGFVRHPWPWAVKTVRWVLGGIHPAVLRGCFRLYPLWARLAYRRAPEVLADLPEFTDRRREPADQAALLHRLRLIEAADFRETAGRTSLPVWQLTGFWDPVVPGFFIRRWLRRNCPGWQESVIANHADHVVLATGVGASVTAVRRWMGLTPRSADRQTR